MNKVSKLVSNEMYAKMESEIHWVSGQIRQIEIGFYHTQKLLNDSQSLLDEIQLFFKKPKQKPNSEIQLYA